MANLRSSGTRRRALHLAVTLGLLGWLAVALTGELRLAARRSQHASAASPRNWRLGSAAVEELREGLAQADRLLPAGSRLAFASGEQRPGAAFFRYRWVAYLLAQRDVVPVADVGSPLPADYLLGHGIEAQSPQLEEIGRLGTMTLYRIRPAATPSPPGAAPP